MTLDTLNGPEWSMEHYQDDNVEHDLYDSVIMEYNDIQGISVEYSIRNEEIEMDYLYGESINTGYLGPYTTKITYEVTEEPTITDPFGITSIDVIQYAHIPKSTFIRDVSSVYGDITYEPKPGDVLKTLWNNSAYEVVDAGEEESIFHLKKSVWDLILKPYRFSDQSESAREISPDVDSTLTEPLSAYGNNDLIEDESDDIDNYTDVDSAIYGF
jgi:hypothetical protein